MNCCSVPVYPSRETKDTAAGCPGQIGKRHVECGPLRRNEAAKFFWTKLWLSSLADDAVLVRLCTASDQRSWTVLGGCTTL